MKTKFFISALTVLLSAGMMSAQNQNQAKEETTVSTQNVPAFVDKNNNGICDHFENGTPGNPNANGKQRLFDGSGRRTGRGAYFRNGRGGGGRFFIDADKNGICDRRE